MAIQTKLFSGHWGFFDTDAPSVNLGYTDALGVGGGVLFHVSEFIVNNGTILEAITDAGSGIVVSDAERTAFHGHLYQSFLDQLAPPSAGQLTYAPIATGVGTWDWMPITTLDPFDKGWHADIAALRVAHVTGVDGDHARVINSPGPHALAIWDINASPTADWVEEAGGAVTSIDTGAGIKVGAVVFDSDDIGEGSVNLWLTSADQTAIALIAGHTTTIGTNTTLATHANRAALDAISSAGSGTVISVAERASVADLASPATPADDDKLWGATAGVGGWVTAPAGGVGTVTAVNGILPIAGDVTIESDDITETAPNLFLTAAERVDISTTKTESAGNATAIAREINQTTLTFTTALPFDAAAALNRTVTLTGNTAPSLITNLAT